MGKHAAPGERIDLSLVDWWAIDLVVKEGVLMNLNSHERVVAAGRMNQAGVREPDIAARLRTNTKGVEALVRRYQRAGLHRQTVSQ